MATAMAWAQQLSCVAPLALQSVNELFRVIEGDTVQQAFNTMRTADLPIYRQLLKSEDAQVGIAAFVERPAADFKGS